MQSIRPLEESHGVGKQRKAGAIGSLRVALGVDNLGLAAPREGDADASYADIFLTDEDDGARDRCVGGVFAGGDVDTERHSQIERTKEEQRQAYAKTQKSWRGWEVTSVRFAIKKSKKS